VSCPEWNPLESTTWQIKLWRPPDYMFDFFAMEWRQTYNLGDFRVCFRRAVGLFRWVFGRGSMSFWHVILAFRACYQALLARHLVAQAVVVSRRYARKV
jgi:hypothetical protein